jgi:hypothetical protein
VELLARLRDGGPQATWTAAATVLDAIDDLPWHLEQAGQPEAIDALLGEETPGGENAWFLARELRGDRWGYLRDIDRAWRRADAAEQAGGGAGPVAAQCRYALIRASAVPTWPDELGQLPALMVASGLWAPQRAVAAVRRIRHCWTRMSAWVALAPHLEEPARQHATHTALVEAMRYPTPEDRARALLDVMPVPTAAERDALLREAVELVREAMRERRATTWAETTLIELVPHLDDTRRANLLRLLVDSPGDLYGSTLVKLMTDLAARLGPDDYRDAVRLVLDGYRGELSWLERARVLSPLGPPSDLRAYHDGLRAALDEARAVLRRAVQQTEHVSELYREHGPGSHVYDIPIDFIGFFSDRCSLLAGPGFDDLREEAMGNARGVKAGYRFRALAVLAPAMGPGWSREVAAEALRA